MKKGTLKMSVSDIPHQFVAVGVEDEGSRPAAFAADFGDLTFSGIVFSATCRKSGRTRDSSLRVSDR